MGGQSRLYCPKKSEKKGGGTERHQCESIEDSVEGRSPISPCWHTGGTLPQAKMTKPSFLVGYQWRRSVSYAWILSVPVSYHPVIILLLVRIAGTCWCRGPIAVLCVEQTSLMSSTSIDVEIYHH